MNSFSEKKIDCFCQQDVLQTLSQITRGFEKECLRIDPAGMIAKTSHPKALGSSLRHPLITTDYSEALLEFITPPLQDRDLMFRTLTELHQFTYRQLENEYLWPASMPCRLPKEQDIPVARYGSSHLGQLKYIYRLGLGYRYGRRMQTIAGIHYNFSFPKTFWQRYALKQAIQGELKDFISEQYLGIIRNAFRFSWMLPFFFGASPAISADFSDPSDKEFQSIQEHTLYLPQATSLRLSDLGYHNKTKSIVNISYNSFPEFLETMHAAVHTIDPIFESIGLQKNGQYLQLSTSSLQTEDEHYALFRPKRIAMAEERMLTALKREGVEYIEVRALDINPFLPLGVEPETVYFLDIFLILCLLMESPLLSSFDHQRIQDNINLVVKRGRDPQLVIKNEQNQDQWLVDWASQLLCQMQIIASVLDEFQDSTVYTAAIQNAQDKLQDPSKLPSAKVLSALLNKDLSFFDFTMERAKNLKSYFEKLPWSEKQESYYAGLAKESLQSVEQIKDTLSFEEFLKNFLMA